MGLNALIMLIILISTMFGCHKRPALPTFQETPGVFFSEQGRALKEKDLLTAASQADFILVGEGHTNVCDHKAQAWLIDMLASNGLTPALGLEMVTIKQQDMLDEFVAGKIKLENLAQKLKWQKVWGHDFELYSPIFALAQKHRLQLIALNLPRKMVRTLAGGEKPTKNEKDLLPPEIVLPAKKQRDSLVSQFSMHQKMMNSDSSMIQSFLNTQALWDTGMAWNAINKTKSKPTVILAGAGHIENGWGIELRLKHFKPKTQVLRIMPIRSKEEIKGYIDNNIIVGARQIFFFCPSSHRSRLGFQLKQQGDMIVVESVQNDSKAYKAGFQAGDIVLKADGKNIHELFDLHLAASRAAKSDKVLNFEILRNNRPVKLKIELKSEK